METQVPTTAELLSFYKQDFAGADDPTLCLTPFLLEAERREANFRAGMVALAKLPPMLQPAPEGASPFSPGHHRHRLT